MTILQLLYILGIAGTIYFLIWFTVSKEKMDVTLLNLIVFILGGLVWPFSWIYIGVIFGIEYMDNVVIKAKK